MTLSFSVIINTLDRAELLGDALDGLMQQRHGAFEVIVVNGPSADATAKVLSRFPKVRLGRCASANLSASRNIGIAMARGEVVAFLDDDAVPEPAWLQGLETGYADRGVGGVGGYICDATGLAYQARVTVCDRLGSAVGFTDLAAAKASLKTGVGRFLSPTGANASYRRAALLEIGGFDETFAYFLDETDVNLRLWEAGWRLTFVEGADVHHRLAASARRDHRNVPHSLYDQCRSKAYFALRHASGCRHSHDILNHLAEHGLELYGHNRALADGGLIDAAHQERLDGHVDQGLRNGVERALYGAPPALLDEATLGAHAHGRFKPVRRPAKSLRLAFVSQQYPPGPVGGIAVWTRNAARALVALGHEVSVIATATASADASLTFEDGVWVHRIVPHHAPERTSPPLPELPQTLRDHAYAVHDALARMQAERGLDLVSWPIWDLEGLAVQSAARVPTVLSLHTPYALAAPFKPDWRDPAYRRGHVDKVIAAERQALTTAPFVLANSAQLLADLDATYGVDLRRPGVWTIPHGLRDRAVAGYRRDDGRVRVLFVGRLEPRKGADLLLDALSRILPTRPQVDVRLVGEIGGDGGGALPQAFARRYGGASWADRVRFDGAVPAAELDRAYADCDVFVAPSRYESFGLVFVEAMMFGKPCIGGRAGGVPEIIVEGETGLLVPPGDASALGRALAALIDDAELRRTLGAAGRSRYLAAFTDARMALGLQAMFREVIAAASQPVGVKQDQLAASSE